MQAGLLPATLLLANAAMAQKDISIKLIKPSPGDVLVKAVQDTVVFRIKNVGTIPVSMMDTIGLMITVDGGSGGMYGTMSTINPGDSMDFEISDFAYSSFTTDKDNASLCIAVMIMSNTDPVTTDNNSCNNVKLRTHALSVSSPAALPVINVYPNPATTQVTISAETAIEGDIQVYDMTGVVVSRQPITAGSAVVSTGAYPPGTYHYRITGKDTELLKAGKLVITR